MLIVERDNSDQLVVKTNSNAKLDAQFYFYFYVSS